MYQPKPDRVVRASGVLAARLRCFTCGNGRLAPLESCRTCGGRGTLTREQFVARHAESVKAPG